MKAKHPLLDAFLIWWIQIKHASVYYRIGVYIDIIGKVIYENVIV